MLARNFKSIEKITLYLAFFINVILLFHRVDIGGMRTSHDSEATEAPGEEEDEEVDEAIYITGMTVPYFAYEITGWILAQVRERWVLWCSLDYFRCCTG